VAGSGGGILGPCPIFDINHYDDDNYDYLALPDGSKHYRDDCPAGAALGPEGSLRWHSTDTGEGSGGNGLPWSGYGVGGGWQVCFT
jgi:hypothetical protein